MPWDDDDSENEEPGGVAEALGADVPRAVCGGVTDVGVEDAIRARAAIKSSSFKSCCVRASLSSVIGGGGREVRLRFVGRLYFFLWVRIGRTFPFHRCPPRRLLQANSKNNAYHSYGKLLAQELMTERGGF